MPKSQNRFKNAACHPETRADSTKGVEAAAKAVFNKWAREVRECSELEKLKLEDVDNDNLQDMLTAFALYLANNQITYAHNHSRYLLPKSCGKYFSSIKQFFKSKFPKLECWATEDTWCNSLKRGIETVGSKELFLAGGANGEVYDGPKCRPLYPVVTPSLVRANERASMTLRGADLKSILHQMVATAYHPGLEAFKNRAKIALTFHGMGRGGETKCLRWTEWEWDLKFDCPEAIWTEVKTVQRYPLDFVANKYTSNKSYLLDIFHSLGCYFAIENGLHRPEDDNAAKLIFPDLYSLNVNSVTGKLTSVLKKYCDEALRGNTSMKSIRRGCSTLLALNKHIGETDRKMRGGHVHAESSDKSLVYPYSCPALTLPSAKALAGWDFPHQDVHCPRIEALSSEDQTKALMMMDHLFPTISVKHFLPKGKLRPLLRVCFASLIMYYPETCNDLFEKHLLPSTIKKSLMATKLLATDLVHPTLLRWAKVIAEDFMTRNQAASGQASIGRVSDEATALTTSTLLSTNADRISSVEKVLTENNRMLTEQKRVIEMLSELLKQYQVPAAEPTGPSPPSQPVVPLSTLTTPSAAARKKPPTATITPSTQNDTTTEVTAAMATTPKPAPAPPAASLKTSTNDSKAPSNSKMTIRSLLIDIFESSQLDPASAVYKPLEKCRLNHVQQNNQADFVRCMNLVTEVWTEDERQFLQMPMADYHRMADGRKQLEDVVVEIQRKCMALVNKRDPPKSKRNNKTTSGFTGVGKRLLKWQKGVNPEATKKQAKKVDDGKGQTKIGEFLSATIEKVSNAMSPSRKRKREDEDEST